MKDWISGLKTRCGLRSRWDTVAHGGAIPPAAHGFEDRLIFRGSGTLENEWAMHTAVGSNDEAHLHFDGRITAAQHGIRRSESLGRMGLLTAGAHRGVRHVGEFGVVDGRAPKLPLVDGQGLERGGLEGRASIGRH